VLNIPKVQIGDLVHWYPYGDRHQKPMAAIVTDCGGQSLALNILGPDTQNFRIRDGVPHMSDPRCGGEHVRESGGWDLSPLMKRLEALEAAVTS